MKAVLLSLNPEWIGPIMRGEKIYEVRKRAPLCEHPYKVYIYCTKGGAEKWLAGVHGKREAYEMNGTICGEFTCTGTTERHPPYSMYGTGLTEEQLKKYDNGAEKLDYMRISNPVMYDKPMSLEDFGLTRPPQSFQYVEEKNGGEEK